MTSLGLVERKQTSSKAAPLGSSERQINPDDEISYSAAIEVNPNINMTHVYQEVKENFNQLQTKYKFIWKEKKRRLQVGCALKRQNNFFHLKWIFFEVVKPIGDVSSCHTEVKKKIHANVDQRVYPFFPFFEQKETKVTLRTTKNDGLIEELIVLAGRQGIDIVPLGPCPGAVVLPAEVGVGLPSSEDAIERALLEQKLREEAEAKELEARKARLAEEEAACRPLPFADPPSFEDQHILDSGAILLGVDEEDITKPIDADQDESVSNAVEIEPKPEEERVPTEEELNEIGKEIFRKDEIHKQIMMALSHTTKYFPLYISVTSPGGLDGKAEAKVQQSVYLISDAQEVYEQHYSKIAPLKQMVVKFFPLAQLVEHEGKYQKSQVWIRDFLTGDLIPLANPDEFSFLFDFAQKDYGTVIHKACLISNETGATKRALNYIQKVFLEDFERSLKNFETNKKYSTAASDVKVAGPAAPPATSAPSAAPPAPGASVDVAGTVSSSAVYSYSVPAQTSHMTHYSSRPILPGVPDDDNDSLF